MHTLRMARRPTPSCWDGKYFLKCGSHPPEEDNLSTFYLFMFDYLFDYLLSWLHHWKDRLLHLSIHQSRYLSPFLALTRSHTFPQLLILFGALWWTFLNHEDQIWMSVCSVLRLMGCNVVLSPWDFTPFSAAS